MSADLSDKERGIREPSLLDALIPLLFMIALLALSIVLFGIDAALGPLQVALLMSAVVAAIVAHKNGHSWQTLGEEIVKGISQRDDDKEEVVRKRLEVYHAQTRVLVDYYSRWAATGDAAAPRYRKVAGVGTVEEIKQRVFDALR